MGRKRGFEWLLLRLLPRSTPHKELLPIRHEWKEMARCPRFEHSSICPPSADVRQQTMAVRIFRCSQVNHFRLCTKNAVPASRIRSATSSDGRVIYLVLDGSGLEA